MMRPILSISERTYWVNSSGVMPLFVPAQLDGSGMLLLGRFAGGPYAGTTSIHLPNEIFLFRTVSIVLDSGCQNRFDLIACGQIRLYKQFDAFVFRFSFG